MSAEPVLHSLAISQVMVNYAARHAVDIETCLQVRQFLLERDLATAINLARELNLDGQAIQRLELAGPPPSYAARIQELAGLPVQYRAKHNAIILDLSAVMTPLPTFDEHLARLLDDQCRQLMQHRRISGVAGQVRKRLLGSLGLATTLEDIATDMNMSPRSLRRKLDEENSSFRSLVEESRRALASQLLESTDMKLDEVALQLGYADTASFTRAFRRWNKQSPGRFRTLKNH